MNAHSVTFDKLVYLDRLKAAGVPDDVARAHAEGLEQALRESVATKNDVEKVETALRTHIEKVETALRGDLERTEHILRTEIAAVRGDLDRTALGFRNDLEKSEGGLRTEIKAVREELRVDLKEAKFAVLQWVLGAIGFQTLVIVGALVTVFKIK